MHTENDGLRKENVKITRRNAQQNLSQVTTYVFLE